MLYANNIILDAFVIFFTFTFLFVSFLYAAGLSFFILLRKNIFFSDVMNIKERKTKCHF